MLPLKLRLGALSYAVDPTGDPGRLSPARTALRLCGSRGVR